MKTTEPPLLAKSVPRGGAQRLKTCLPFTPLQESDGGPFDKVWASVSDTTKHVLSVKETFIHLKSSGRCVLGQRQACMVVRHFRRVRLSATPRTVARRGSLSTGCPRQGYWSGLQCPSPGIFPDWGLNPHLMSAVLAGKSFLYHGHHLGSPWSQTLERFWKY